MVNVVEHYLCEECGMEIHEKAKNVLFKKGVLKGVL